MSALCSMSQRVINLVKLMKTKTFDYYADPGHGWVKAERKLLQTLGIERGISIYSYQRGDFVYLEEDCDAGKLFGRLRLSGVEPKYRYRVADKRSKIRGYESFKPQKAG